MKGRARMARILTGPTKTGLGCQLLALTGGQGAGPREKETQALGLALIFPP